MTRSAPATGERGVLLLADRLREQRRRMFVGRTDEIELFRSAFLRARDPATVLFVHGPGGTGKSVLLDVLADVAAADGATPVRLDGRDVPPGAGGLLGAFAAALGHDGDPLPVLARLHRPVLLIDTYELLAAVDRWIRVDLLPALPDTALVVIASRQPPAASWLADPAWSGQVHVAPLADFTARDGRALLTAHGVPDEVHGRLLALSHGHPLTLAMLVEHVRRRAVARGDAGWEVPRELSDVPDVVQTLLVHSIEQAPGPAHRRALEVCAHAHVTTEHLLRAALGEPAAGEPDPAQLYTWLRSLSFVEEGRYGLFPHDLARDVLDGDFRRRDPHRYADLHHRVRAELLARIRSAGTERTREQLLADAIFVACPRTRLATYVSVARTCEEYSDDLRDTDRAAIVEMTAASQGHGQAELVAYWMHRQPRAFRVFRDARDGIRGYGARLEVQDATAEDLATDPGVAAMWRYAQERAPARPGEDVVAWRFVLDRDAHHGSSPSSTLFAAWQVLDILTRERVAWSFVSAYTDAELWAPTMGYLDFWRAAGADFAVDGTGYAVFAHDWRRTDVGEWLQLVAAREVGGPARPATEPPPEPVLSQLEFAAAVRDALRDLHAPQQLGRNPLLRAPVVRRHERDGRHRTHALRDLLVAAAEALPADRHNPGLREIVDRTFLRPTGTQEQVAERLHLSFSTYRRHRDRAVALIADWMWQREIEGSPGPVGGSW